MAASIYTVTTTLLPDVPIDVEQAELERLDELNLIDELLNVRVSAERVVITDGEIPPFPSAGTVWFDRSMP